MEMTLSRALRYKKRIIEKIRKAEADIQTNNSKVDGEDREVDVKLSMRQRQAWVNHLIDFKLALQKATQPIQRLIFELAETKAELSFIQRIDTQKGLVQNHFNSENSLKYNVVLDRKEIDELAEMLQQRVDDLQTKIDAHNATTNVVVSDPDLS